MPLDWGHCFVTGLLGLVPVDAHSRSATFRNEDLDKEVVSKRESNHGMAEILGGLFGAYGHLGDIL